MVDAVHGGDLAHFGDGVVLDDAELVDPEVLVVEGAAKGDGVGDDRGKACRG